MDNRTVLLVEDDETLLEMYTIVIERAGIKVIQATTGKAGVRAALKHHPDVILMDVMLPDIDGHEAVQQLRLNEWGKTATVIFLTNRSDAESIVKAVEEGGDEYIIKSHTDSKELLNKVRSAMVAQ
jgi:DNA-binding response OmpR family regulator